WGAYEFYPRGKYTVLAEGNVIGELDHSTGEKLLPAFFRHRDEPFVAGADLFEKYVESRFRIYKTEAHVTDGQLNVLVRPDTEPRPYVGPLNAVVVFPVSESAAGEEELQRIKDARRAQFEKQYKILDLAELYVEGLTDEEKARGFATWTAPYGQEIDLWDGRDRRAEREKLSALVTRGEMEPVVVCVHPLEKEPGRIACEVGELVGDKGDRLPASTVSVRVVKPWEMQCKPTESLIRNQLRKKVQLRPTDWVVVPRPYFLLERNWFDGQRKINRLFWLTIRMPEDARSRVYTGTVTVAGPKGKLAMPLTVTVVPVKLERVKQAIGLNYGRPDYPQWFDDLEAADRFWKMVEKDLQLMYDYGLTTVAASGFRLPRADHPDDPNTWERFIRLHKKIGFERELYHAGVMGLYRSSELTSKHGSQRHKAWQDAYCKVFRDYDAVAAKLRQKVIYSIGDETTNEGREALIHEVAKVVKRRLDDLLICSDINGYRELMALAPLVDICGFNNGWHGSYGTNRKGHDLMTRDVIERVRSRGATPWFINGGKGRYPFSIWFWKCTKWGVDGKIEWHYDASSADPYNPFDGTSRNDFGSLVLPDQVSTVQFELCREGIDDLRYLAHLEGLIAKQAKSKDRIMRDVAARAREALDYYNDSVADRFRSTSTADGSGEYSGDAWPDWRLAEMRRELAMLICMLEDVEVPGIHDEVMLIDGEDERGRELGGVAKRVEGHATRGEHSYALFFEKGKGYADQWGRPATKDWRGYRSLTFDVINPQQRDVTLMLQLRDQVASNIGDYDLRHIVPCVCRPGENTFTVGLVGMKASNADHVFDMSCLFSYFFTVADEEEDVTLYVDNMRLSPEPAERRAHSAR
ncbi:MAG: hypothetical protein ACE5JM_02075, partial [Armatimonadota bacterium]